MQTDRSGKPHLKSYYRLSHYSPIIVLKQIQFGNLIQLTSTYILLIKPFYIDYTQLSTQKRSALLQKPMYRTILSNIGILQISIIYWTCILKDAFLQRPLLLVFVPQMVLTRFQFLIVT